jgi:GDPmannose 4,6-dehydratase
LKEKAYVKSFDPAISPGLKKGSTIISIDKKYFRPNDVTFLKGDSSKARKKLGWKPKIKFKELVHEMLLEDYEFVKKNFIK